MQHNYLASKKENSEFHMQNLKNFDAGNMRRNNDSINLAHLNPQIRKLRIKNSEKVVIGNLNINSLPNKFDQLKETVLKYVDVLVLTESKLDDSFTKVQFLVDGFSEPYRYDRNRNGGGIMIYIRDNIPSKLFRKNINFMMIWKVFLLN